MVADKAIMCYVQESHISSLEYFERFNALVDSAISYGSSIGHSAALVNSELSKMGMDWTSVAPDQTTKATEIACKAYLLMLMLDGACYFRFKDPHEELDNNFANGNDMYPIKLNVVLWLLNSRKPPSMF